VIAKSGGGLEEIFGGGAAFDEVIDGGLRRAETVGGLDGFGSLEFGFALRDVGDDAGVDGGDVTAGNGRGFHDAGFDGAADVVLSGGDVFHAFGDGPAVGSGFEVPLGGGEALGGVEDVFLVDSSKARALSFSAGVTSWARAASAKRAHKRAREQHWIF